MGIWKGVLILVFGAVILLAAPSWICLGGSEIV